LIEQHDEILGVAQRLANRNASTTWASYARVCRASSAKQQRHSVSAWHAPAQGM
jgi:hypothetical protein